MESFGEYGIGLSLLAKGWDEAAHFAEFPFRVIFIFCAGVFILAGTKLRHRIEKKVPNFHGVFEILEGLVEIAVGTILLEEGKQFIPVFLAFVGLIYLSRGVTYLATKPENREKAFKRFRKILGLAMIVFAVTMAAINAMTRNEPMVYIATGALVVGAVIALVRRHSTRTRLGIVEKLIDRKKK